MSNEQQKLDAGTHVLIPKGERWLRYISLVSVIGVIFAMGVWTATSRTLMFDNPEQKNKITTHISPAESEKHKTFEDMELKFVTRKEYELLKEL